MIVQTGLPWTHWTCGGRDRLSLSKVYLQLI